MPYLNTEFVNILSRVERPGTYYARLQTDWHLPTIKIDGVGRLALPVLPYQAEQLLTVASQAPYGKGEETLVDTAVRNTQQIEADQVHISGKHWNKMLERMLNSVQAALGVQGKITASLYKLLIYGEGSFFINHRDTEKAPGMFGSMIIALPSDYQGGELRLEHAGQEVVLDLRTDDSAEIAFAAFYADCVHAVLPVIEGYRVVLAYNLCIDSAEKTAGRLLNPPNYQTELQQLTTLLSGWEKMEHKGEDIPLKLVYLLEHAYTPDGLVFSALKNGDAAIAELMTVAAEKADCDCYLALLSVEESGSAESHGGYSGWGYDDYDEDDFEVDEVCNERRYISNWHQVNQTTIDLGELPFDDEELCLPERLTTLEPDELEFHEATGNAGASFERTYRRAVLVLWPRKYAADALAVGGVEVSISYLRFRVQQWVVTGQGRDSQEWKEAQLLSQAIIRDWPDAPENIHAYYPRGGASEMLTSFLELVIKLKDTTTIEIALRDIATTGKAYQAEDNLLVMHALNLLPEQAATPLLFGLLENRAAARLSACAQLLRDSLIVYSGINKQSFQPVVTAFLANLPEGKPVFSYFGGDKGMIAEQVVDVLIAIGNVDEVSGKQAVETMIARRDTFPMDEVLIPATIMLAEAEDRPSIVARHLHQACLAYLDVEISKPLEAPQNWTRETDFSCSASDEACLSLKTFLKNPDQKVWEYAAREALRKHLSSIASRAVADVAMQTIKRGSPHILHFTKTDASYQRRVEQRKVDEKNRAKLVSISSV